MKKHCFVVLLVLAVVLSLSSCKKLTEEGGLISSINPFKKSETTTTAPATTGKNNGTVAKTETRKPAVAKPEEKPAAVSAPKAEPVSSKATEALLETVPAPLETTTATEIVATEEVKGFIPVTVSYNGSCFTLNGTFGKTEAIIECKNMPQSQVFTLASNIVETYPGAVELFSFYMEDSTLHLVYETLTEDEIYAYLSILENFVASYDKALAEEAKTVVEIPTVMGEVTVDILPMEASVTLPSSVTKEDVDTFLSTFATACPEVAEATSYTYDEGVVTITFAEPLEKEVVEEYWGEMKKSMGDLIVETPVKEESAPVVEMASGETVEENKTSNTGRISEEVPGPKPMVPAAPKTKAGLKVKEMSYAVAAYGGMDAVHSGIGLGVEGRFEAHLWDDVSLGAKLALEKGFALPLVVYGRYDIASDVYAFAGLGLRLPLKNLAETSVLVEAGVGYEWEITDDLHFFAEAALRYAGNFGVYGKVGGRYSF